ncbi:orotidine 5'-phosphate decarboxylase [Elasticomyces elasticus]|nr:orotidine 5'-phosphate decarboxylase [Elasticomyces elasticus]KAK3665406.1 orotidine 5'-phosphate decarboxylase [Elasticomyces elasticus]KAK4929949.1 orotidine 5'-phosphate decarboxylase [Elasticomyces elasticus]KAK5684869.1 orotidine 5'-phosphate decarboxylase [Elasticomyces elasticus]KAK5769240.1 orotidine 5'-phosphate decarboxylase [Elasticomyces elasticus]
MAPSSQRHPTLFQSYGERSEQPNLTPLASYLLRLIHLKRTNLCVSADVNTTTELLQLAEEVGEHICVLKTHADIIDDFSDRTIRGLNEISRRKKFLIFEDRKFGDIGSTLQQQYTRGPLAIVKWASLVNAALFPGPAVITALAEAAQKAIAAHNTSVSTDISASPAASLVDSGRDDESVEGASDDDDDDDEDDDDDDDIGSDVAEASDLAEDRKGRKQSVVSVSTTISTKTEAISPQPALRPTLSRDSTQSSDAEEAEEVAAELAELGPPPFYRSLLLLAQMSSAGNLLTPDYTAQCVHHARRNRDFVMGFIAQQSLNKEAGDNFITMTPGVQLTQGGDAHGQQYNTPQKVIAEGGTDIIIVGRGVYGAPVSERKAAALKYRQAGWNAYQQRLRAGRQRR